ncbi:3033_t:CDS:2, partial [Scutellospora calospora]
MSVSNTNGENSINANDNSLTSRSNIGESINLIIGAGIFITPGSIWRLVQSPGAALMLWIVGGLLNLFKFFVWSFVERKDNIEISEEDAKNLERVAQNGQVDKTTRSNAYAFAF